MTNLTKNGEGSSLYDLAVSYASEDLSVAEYISADLTLKGYNVYFDHFEQAKMIGEDLTAFLGDVYSNRSRFCLILISKSYVEKPWTNHERQFALSRAMKERGAYILPLKLDETDLPGLSPTVGYLDLRNSDISEVCRLLTQKLGVPAADLETYSGKLRVSKAKIRDVLSVCYRRAVFTRFHAEMRHEVMFDSFSECRVALQKLVMHVTPAEAQRLVAGIIAEIDLIERIGTAEFTWSGSGTAATIDGAKLRIIHSLCELARQAKLPLQFPRSLTEEFIFSSADADSPPAGPDTQESWIGGCGSIKARFPGT